MTIVKTKMKHYKLFVLLILAVFVMTSGFGCKGVSCGSDEELQKITLEYWGVWDTAADVQVLIDQYEESHPTIDVTYRNFRYDEYERKLLEAWADDRGPDIFAIPVTWLKAYQHRIVPMPDSTSVPVLEMKGAIREEPVITAKRFAGLKERELKEKYVPVVYNDVVIDGDIYGLPYSLDTLVTFYNYDILIKAGIPEPIKDWHELVEQTPKLTKATEDNYVLQSAVALGGGNNIPRFLDIISNIMLQNGANLKGDYFDPLDKDVADRFIQALKFYTDFARPGRASFSWTDNLPNAFELFASGRLAYFFGYSYHANELRDRGVAFDWEITNFPQARGADGSKYYTDYWINVVAKKSNDTEAAWNFVHTTSARSHVSEYLEQNKLPTALKSLIDEQRQDDDLVVFVSQVLTADNWYEGYNISLAEEYAADLITDILSGDVILDVKDAGLKTFVNHINNTYAKPE